ncbi:MAG: hypothetical protein COV10_00370 [Candidatus Vogelbacteria bacterium CG10_big_fil_rev_8_21_14_0_10_51_16]|uniref:Uncharacterized protein n=1 Tax=Candidatus Vogelbacteria bacterium CG10_big_fil_rev_8_21_14_0_10_51_16 TaxID=1975045 RepID=A0A2H0RFE6_9BACT|nr:MAG: hypothetical protein COV10_00370 [Candidatus Vogelbacteria bacterium CG10_big_fil_rev_8_21_14_0_10_51_16]
MTNLHQKEISDVAEKGAEIYDAVKATYEPQEKGKFLAIDVVSKSAYLGISSAEALTKARKEHPDRIFYVVKIGYDVAETMAHMLFQTKIAA